ncbi:hypothetical protein NDU88_005915 [Pleurodeles waltl]|uniref:Uncharacterized protein n=1 Tax=Pleurodeles waltl TaxID=8319 RepID=A0AAV7WCS7_PLEWA|nr:hypothetical protein NDU88_005915 [Pleurodeles waltl]
MRRDERGEKTNEEDAEAGKSTEEEDVGRTEESGERSSEVERAWETEFAAKHGQTPKDAEIARHVPGGTWLIQKGAGKARGDYNLRHATTQPHKNALALA